MGVIGAGVHLGRLERAFAWFSYGFYRLDFTGLGSERAGMAALGSMGACLVLALGLLVGLAVGVLYTMAGGRS